MKRFNYILFIIIATLSACSFLDLEPKDELTRDNFYKNDREVTLALSGVYAQLRTLYAEDFSVWLNVGTDEMLYRRATFGKELSRMSYNESDIDLARIWKNSYTAINIANDFIGSLSALDSIPNLKRTDHDLMLGEALTLRAMFYFNMVRMWEHIPLRLDHFTDLNGNLEDLNLPNVPANKIYNQIVADLETSLELMNERPKQYGRVSKQIAHGILARVFLNMAGARVQGGDFGKDYCLNKVVEHTNAVVNYGYHTLLPEYEEVFLNEIKGIRNDVEVMWEVDFTVSDSRNLGGRIGNFNGVQISFTSGNQPFATANSYIAPTMHNALYSNTDTRKAWNCADFSFNNDGDFYFPVFTKNQLRWYPGKWRRLDLGRDSNGELDDTAESLEMGVINKDRTSINFPLLRYSDVLLMRAEALYLLQGENEQSNQDIELVRNRANAGTLEEGLMQVDGNYMKLIQEERRRELCYEGHRRFDLVRWGTLLETMRDLSENIRANPSFREEHEIQLVAPGERVEEKHVVFPIPSDELQINVNIKQHNLW
ncbi:RagB/SusD family nutrient uptake outer membrane protein [Flammeovirga sp. EKP202]|uniref:RagB/SusD family nutrient uptake outer membrane protein n=1 Tax=Flammeovirga sp. EKP202 TaxID=2770592 RepID=UPI00165FE495|nr:RagB/SusD family nutrient uptake outer membrane protein [Flammeovirga sp. EKP202]MBD0400579.1 RagB/SusD family nutrient uptake outer membrane protein [Flammeovirga sp. EKP202]